MCSVPWCKELPVVPTDLCLTHIHEHGEDTSPILDIVPGNLREVPSPQVFGNFFFFDETTDGGQVREVPEGIYPPEVSIKSQPEVGITLE